MRYFSLAILIFIFAHAPLWVFLGVLLLLFVASNYEGKCCNG